MKQIQRVDTTPETMQRLYVLAERIGSSRREIESTGLELAAAQELMHRIRAGLRTSTAPFVLSTGTARQIADFMLMQRKISAIEAVIAEIGFGLAEAKDMVDQMEATIRSSVPLYVEETITPRLAPAQQASGIDLVAQFNEQLRQARLRAGQESYRRISDRLYEVAEYYAAPTTVHRLLNGKTVPAWDAVEALLRVFRIPNDEIQKHWHPLWARARAHQLGAKFPEGTSDRIPPPSNPAAPAGGHECEACGAWVTNLERHHAWHWRVENTSPATEDTRKISTFRRIIGG